MKRYVKYKDSGISWIREVPERWQRCRYKDILIPQDIRVGNKPSYTLLSLTKQGVIIRDLSEGKGKFPKDFESYKVIVPNNLILCLFDVDETPRTVGVAHDHGMITGAYDIFNVKRANLNYVYYHYLSLDDRKCLKPLYKGLRKTIPLPRLLSTYFYIPPADEQRAIVEYLDSAVGRINGYIAEKEAEIEKLGLLKQSVIAHAVTKGINPNAKMKDSGIPWIGEVPEGWKVVRLFSVASEHFISNQKIHHQNLLSLSYGQIIRKNIDCTKGLLPETFDKYQVVEPGNIVLRFTDLQNDHRSLRVGLVKEEGIITSAYLCIASRDNVVPEYLYLILHVNDIHKVFYGMGGGLRQSLDFSEFRKLPVLLPPFSEQRAIVEFIDGKVKEIDGFISAVREQIEKLKLYKQRLISDVVTGKIKVCKDTLAEEVI